MNSAKEMARCVASRSAMAGRATALCGDPAGVEQSARDPRDEVVGLGVHRYHRRVPPAELEHVQHLRVVELQRVVGHVNLDRGASMREAARHATLSRASRRARRAPRPARGCWSAHSGGRCAALRSAARSALRCCAGCTVQRGGDVRGRETQSGGTTALAPCAMGVGCRVVGGGKGDVTLKNTQNGNLLQPTKDEQNMLTHQKQRAGGGAMK